MKVRLEGMQFSEHPAGRDYAAYSMLKIYTSREANAADKGQTVGRITHEYSMKIDSQPRSDLAQLFRVVDPGSIINLDIIPNGKYENIAGFELISDPVDIK